MTNDPPQSLDFVIEFATAEHPPRVYIKFDGQRIARREDGRWVSIDPDWRVELDGTLSHRSSWAQLDALTQRRRRGTRRNW